MAHSFTSFPEVASEQHYANIKCMDLSRYFITKAYTSPLTLKGIFQSHIVWISPNSDSFLRLLLRLPMFYEITGSWVPPRRTGDGCLLKLSPRRTGVLPYGLIWTASRLAAFRVVRFAVSATADTVSAFRVVRWVFNILISNLLQFTNQPRPPFAVADR